MRGWRIDAELIGCGDRSEFTKIENKDAAVGSGSPNLVAATVPANFENAAGAFVAVNQLATLGRPNVHTFVETSACEEFPVRTERDAINGLRVLRQGVNTRASLDVPKPDGRVERSTGQRQVHIWIVSPRPSWRPLDSVNLFAVGLEIVHPSVLFHRPNLQTHIVRTTR